MTDDSLTLDDLPQPEFDGALPPEALELDGNNPNEMSDENFETLVDRIREQGWLGGPILTDLDGIVADGEHRLRAARELGLEEVPVRKYDWTEAQRRLVRIEMNKNTGEHDPARDAQEYDFILDHGYVDEVDRIADIANDDVDSMLDDLLTESSGDDLEFDADNVNDPYDEWDDAGTAEYENEDKTPEFSIKVHFESKRDLRKFGELVGRDLNENTRYIYFPDEPEQPSMTGKEFIAKSSDDDD